MAKKKKRTNKKIQAPKKAGSSSQGSNTPINIVDSAVGKAAQDGLSPTPSESVPVENIDELKKILDGVIKAYKSAEREVEDRKKFLSKSETQADLKNKKLIEKDLKTEEKEKHLASWEKELGSTRAELKEKNQELDQLRIDAIEREENVKKREIEADAGFPTRREDFLTELDEAHQELFEKNTELAQSLEKERHLHTKELLLRERDHREGLKQRELEFDEVMKMRSQGLNEREQEIRLQENEIENIKRETKYQNEEAQSLRESLRELIDEEAQEKSDDAIRSLEGRIERLNEQIRVKDLRIGKHEEAERMLSHHSPEELKKRLDDLKMRNEKLLEELANRPTKEQAEDLSRLREDERSWERERSSLSEKIQTSARKLKTRALAVDELQGTKDHNRVLEATNTLLKAAIDQLEIDLDERIGQAKNTPVFPEFIKMDLDSELGQESIFKERELVLETFVDDLQHIIGRSPKRPNLYYHIDDLRAFVAGLAMSHLSLLHGISGIGKSSLPRRFAEVLGGDCVTVTVQAGWRDRNDLLGYYNSFEGRYYESEFVQALYKAQTPKYKNQIFIILLDEMNLSHPEHYAADVLDVLERQDENERHFDLMTITPKGEAPIGLRDKKRLPLPPNVWFVGTANHDETTKDFADKTYDRSFVLSLPSRPKTFEFQKGIDSCRHSFAQLDEAFSEAEKAHKDCAQEAIAWLEDNLAEPMAERFNIGFGGRLNKQLSRFVPVFVAAGGSVGNALDQIIESRLLRKIKRRYDVLEEDVRHVLEILTENWIGDEAPKRSITLLEGELKRIGADV